MNISLNRDVCGEMSKLNYIYLIIVTKADLKSATGVDTLKFAKKVDLASLKSEIDKLDIDKFELIQLK